MKSREMLGARVASAAGVGSLARGALIVKVLATAGHRGLGLVDIANRTNLPRPSVHRVLQQLLDERLVARSSALRRYRLGPLAFELGQASTALYGDLRTHCAGPLQTLSERTGDTSYLVVRSGLEAVCLLRQEGAFPVKALVLEVGGRHPLGAGAAGLALLAGLEPDERLQAIERLAASGCGSRSDLERDCAQADAAGVAVVHETLSLGVSAVGLAFRDALGRPVGALSVAALSHRMAGPRVQTITQLLRDGCAAVQGELRRAHLDGWASGR